MNRVGVSFSVLAIGWMAVAAWSPAAEAGGVASIGESGEVVELRHQMDGRTVVDPLPLYRANGVRYFSAGVGLEERAAEYPPFPLKLIFAAGDKLYLTGVAVTIASVGGGPTVSIPMDHVGGPWLFVDLPAGVYDVTAAHGGKARTLKQVKVEAGKQKTLTFRWAEESGFAAKLPAD
jgi:hypothetical protein